jgi:hypothetical protein
MTVKRLRDPQYVLILLFLGILGGVPLIQVLIEVRQEERVRVFDIFGQAPTAENLRAYEKGLEAANWAARQARPWMQYAQFTYLQDGGGKAVLGRDGWYFYKPGLNAMLARREPKGAAGSVSDPLPAIVDFRDQLEERGIRLIVMPVPNKESVYPDRLTSRADTLRAGVLAPRTRELLDRLRAEGVEVIDLFQRFGEARQEGEGEGEGAGALRAPLYLAQDTHWSPAGVDVAAREAARRLRDLGWLAPGGRVYRERPVTIQRWGDVLRMLQSPPIERHVMAETVPCMQVIQGDDDEPYRETAEAEVLVLGDSFMRIYQQDAPGSAGFIAHLAKELGRPVMSLVNDGGGSTLVRRELGLRPLYLRNKKVVLWEFVERDIHLGEDGWRKVPLPPVEDDGMGG